MTNSEIKYCCEMMEQDLGRTCDIHTDRADCPDALISFDAEANRYGLYIHDGGSSIIRISYCPWCGTDLVMNKSSNKP